VAKLIIKNSFAEFNHKKTRIQLELKQVTSL